MGAKSVLDDILITLLWAGDMLTCRNMDRLTESFETWERRQGLHRQLQSMARRAVIQRETVAGNLVYSLTETGRLAALGGRDAAVRWSRPWDGKWRQLLFDLPVTHKKARIRLWRWLRQNDFGYLQQSAWIHPDPLTDITNALRGFHKDVETAIVMEAQCAGGYADESVVCGAWAFDEINSRYENYLTNFRPSASATRKLVQSAEDLGNWLRREKIAWRHAQALDPLLPEPLWPRNYRGKIAWDQRREVHQRLAAAVLS
jgi:phenylacetic acid degradation operon negative regulatory protein